MAIDKKKLKEIRRVCKTAKTLKDAAEVLNASGLTNERGTPYTGPALSYILVTRPRRRKKAKRLVKKPAAVSRSFKTADTVVAILTDPKLLDGKKVSMLTAYFQ